MTNEFLFSNAVLGASLIVCLGCGYGPRDDIPEPSGVGSVEYYPDVSLTEKQQELKRKANSAKPIKESRNKVRYRKGQG